ncbi:pyridoxal-phosphate dependent enzyme [Brenneria uluponensis]|uniref:pyridoxal-phosphate dependent enzyme n=1 Tax=Brenneria uluponensis TaxID=3057057 RepID=UPI0028EB505E|nr:pyridoxal-phosphate dependent enzyme [Brenneria ulupoensis]
MQNLVDQMVMVNETQISEAMHYAENRLHQILEPSGAAGIAGLLAYAAKIAPESHIAVILTGANSDTTEDSESPDIG